MRRYNEEIYLKAYDFLSLPNCMHYFKDDAYFDKYISIYINIKIYELYIYFKSNKK